MDLYLYLYLDLDLDLDLEFHQSFHVAPRAAEQTPHTRTRTSTTHSCHP